jgi:hypothetical protein
MAEIKQTFRRGDRNDQVFRAGDDAIETQAPDAGIRLSRAQRRAAKGR